MVKRSRLPRGNPNNNKDRLKREVTAKMKGLSNERLIRYAQISEKEAMVNPTLGILKEVATKELDLRQKQLAVQKRGAVGLLPKPKADVRSKVQQALGLLRKGVGEFFKVVSGEKAREIEEAIATVGMSEAEKQAFKSKVEEQRRAEAREEAEVFERFAPALVEEKPMKPPKEKDAKDVHGIMRQESEQRDVERENALFREGNIQDMVEEGRRDLAEAQRELGLDQERHHGRTKEEDVQDIISEGQRFIQAEREAIYGKPRKKRRNGE
jgi:hypothetical protein